MQEGPSRSLRTPCLQDIPKKSDTSGSGERGEGQGGVLAPNWNRMEAKGIQSWLGSGGLKERVVLHRGTGWGFGRQAQMGEDLDDHRGLFDGGDERHRAAAVETGGHVDREDAFEQLGSAQAGLP